MPDTFPVMGSDGKPLKDENGKEVRVSSRMELPDKPPQDVSKQAPGEKRWIETDENGNKIEHARVEPTVPAAR
jgi:hypothetical protein